jgi:nitrogen fixation NifU-like protein
MAGLEGLYQQIILDHSKERHGDHPLEGADGEHHEYNPTCGDEITVRVKLDPAHERIDEVAWQGDGCSISMASASVLTDLVQGHSIDEALATADAFRTMLRSKGEGEPDEEVLGDAIAFHGVAKYVMRIKCAMLSWVALEAAVKTAR